MSVREAVAGLSEEIREMAAGDKGADAGYTEDIGTETEYRDRDRDRIERQGTLLRVKITGWYPEILSLGRLRTH